MPAKRTREHRLPKAEAAMRPPAWLSIRGSARMGSQPPTAPLRWMDL